MKSMTGYGSAEGKVGRGRIFAEIKSVNHRYYDVALKIPPRLNPLDPHIRTILKNIIGRGKVEIFLKERRGITESKNLSVDIELAKKYHKCLEKLQRELGQKKSDLNLLEIIDVRDLITTEDINIDYSRYWNDIKKIVLDAAKKLDKMRLKEGAFILNDQRMRLKKIGSYVDRITAQSAESLKKYKTRIRERFCNGEGPGAIPKERIDSEIAFLAEKADIAEELTRLKSHLEQYGQILGQKGAQGRQLDFLLQEMNREINTLGAKAGDAAISKYVINVKSELEKLREQVQNIE